jgi:pimeloyl-ACP methyl ester carboxylesterase
VALLAASAALLVLLWPGRAVPVDAWLPAAGLTPLRARVGADEIRYVRKGSGPPVLLVHGIASSIYTWKDVLPDLARRHEVVALDLPGFGGSSQPPDLSLARLPAAVIGLADHLGLERFALVGHSLGGAVSTLVAARQPGRVERLVLIDAAGYNQAPGQRPWLLRLIASPAGAPLEALPAPPRWLVWLGLRQVFEDDSRVDAARVDAYAAPAARPGAAAAMRALLGSDPGADFAAEARAVRAPTLVIWGAADRWTPVEHAERFRRDVAGARVEVLPGSGHMPQEERPEDVRRLLREFLAER